MPSAFRSSKSTPIPDELVALVVAALRQERTLEKYNADKAKEANDLRAYRDAMMKQHGLPNREATRRVIEQIYPGLDEKSPEFKTAWETLRKPPRKRQRSRGRKK
jgi:hypothetical protein